MDHFQMTNNMIWIQTLLLYPEIGRKTARKILDSCLTVECSAEVLLEASITTREGDPRVPRLKADQLSSCHDHALYIAQRSEELNIAGMCIWDHQFPEELKRIDDPPLLIYASGNYQFLKEDRSRVAIVGTRNPTDYGRLAAKTYTQEFTELNFVIVSGLAIGCDTIAHKVAVEHDVPTIAVLPSGLDSIYPNQNVGLAREIVSQGGLLISEYPVGTKEQKRQFIDRNRLQSGLSQAVVIIETELGGGTMHTYNFARRQGKRIAVVDHPEQFWSAKSEGNQGIIENGHGVPLRGTGDLVDFIKSLKKD